MCIYVVCICVCVCVYVCVCAHVQFAFFLCGVDIMFSKDLDPVTRTKKKQGE